MTELNFILSLSQKLSGLPQDEVEERLNFYREMIEDRMEEGLSEEEAVAAVGTVDEIAAQIIADGSSPPPVKKPQASAKSRKPWEIVLLAVGSPIWGSLLIAAFAVVFSLYVSLLAVVISLWSIFASLAACALGFLAAGIVLALFGRLFPGAVLLGGAMVCAGLSIFLFYGCRVATKGALLLPGKLFQYLRRRFSGKEAVQ